MFVLFINVHPSIGKEWKMAWKEPKELQENIVGGGGRGLGP